MKIVVKRVIAYVIDLIIVTLISTILTTNTYLNKDYGRYIETYDKYEKYYESYEKEIEKLEELNDKEKISDKEYKKELEKINKKNIDYNYEIIKLSIMPTIISILVILLYFVVIQFYMGGKTLGKKIMKLRVVSNKEKKLNILNFLLRSLVLNSVFVNIMSVIFVIVLSKKIYLIFNEIIYVVSYILEMTIIFMIIFDKNNRGLHDYVANTKVIYEGEKYDM